jgi:hypothetical protein
MLRAQEKIPGPSSMMLFVHSEDIVFLPGRRSDKNAKEREKNRK